MNPSWYANLAWVTADAALGLAASGLLASVLRLPRRWFVLFYGASAVALLYGFFSWSAIDLGQLVAHQWPWGLAGALVVGAFVVNNIRSQPASPGPAGWQLVFDLLWLGVVYGAVDALLLSVLPVLATWQALAALGWTVDWPGRLGAGLLALAASAAVAAVYHLGFTEFRGRRLAAPLIGNSVMSLGNLVTGNPLAAVVSHIAMHVAGVLRGPASVVQLPPHYD